MCTCTGRSPSMTLPPYFIASSYATRNSEPGKTSNLLATFQKTKKRSIRNENKIILTIYQSQLYQIGKLKSRIRCRSIPWQETSCIIFQRCYDSSSTFRPCLPLLGPKEIEQQYMQLDYRIHRSA